MRKIIQICLAGSFIFVLFSCGNEVETDTHPGTMIEINYCRCKARYGEGTQTCSYGWEKVRGEMTLKDFHFDFCDIKEKENCLGKDGEQVYGYYLADYNGWPDVFDGTCILKDCDIETDNIRTGGSHDCLSTSTTTSSTTSSSTSSDTSSSASSDTSSSTSSDTSSSTSSDTSSSTSSDTSSSTSSDTSSS